ncbi:MAG: tetratricopeptide repeat protein [Acidobacteriota bacterium]|nr:tetratricopeptide repeat protein [Acidobacteriota bacterium]
MSCWIQRYAALIAVASFACAVVAQGPGATAAADAALSRGGQALRANQPAQAVIEFTTLTHLRPQLAEAYLNLGLALEQTEDFRAAAGALSKAISLKPTIRGANLFLGIADYQLNSFSSAEQALLREVHLSPKDPKALMWLGIAQLAQGHDESAAASLDAAATLSPKDPDILYHRGRAHLLVSKSSYAQMFALEPDSYRVHEVLGQADAEADRTPDAIGEYKLAIDRAPTKQGLHEELADLYWVSGKMDLADAAYVEELAIDKNSTTTLYKLGSLRVIVGQPQQALPMLEQTIKLEPAFESAYYYLGRAQIEVGQDATGIANLLRASAAKGDTTLNTLAFYQLARVYRRLHRTDEANAALTQFRTLRDEAEKVQADKRDSAIDKHRQLPREEPIPTEGEPN